MPEMPRKAAWNGLPGGPGGAWGHGWAARGPGGAWGHGWSAGGVGGPERPPIAPTPSSTGGNCTNRATTRRRHAVKQLLMLQNPPITRQEGTTRTEEPGHDAWERLQRPRPRQLNHHERSLGSAAPPAAPASATPPTAPASDVPTRRITGPQRSQLSGYRPRATTHPDRKPTSGYLNNLSTSP